MRKVVLALLALTAMIAGIWFVACGQSDPSLAPMFAMVYIADEETEEWTYECLEDWDLNSECYDEIRADTLAYCLEVVGETQEFCETNGGWLTLVDGIIGQLTLRYSGTPGSCGWITKIVTAFVFQGNAEGASVEDLGDPMNNVEIRFTKSSVDAGLYLPDETPRTVPPLENPFVTTTNDRGFAEVLFDVPIPVKCGSTTTNRLRADASVDYDFLDIKLEVQEAEDDGSATVDDDDA